MKSGYKQLGEYIEEVTRTNSDLKYGIDDVRGCSNTKKMMQTRANLIGRTYEKFLVLQPGEFVFNRRTTRNGEKIGMAYNDTDREYIFTEDYVAFRVKDECLSELLPDYLYLFFCRSEFDRYARYKSTGSATEFFNWEDMCAVPFTAPDLEEQKKIVHAYKVIEDRINLKKRINENLDATMQEVYRYYFVDFEPFKAALTQSTKLGEIPDTWNLCKLSDMCELLNGRAYSQEELLHSGKYRVLRVGNFFTKSSWYYSNMELEENKYCYPDDLLFCWSASFGLHIWNDVKTIYHYHIWKIDFSKTSQQYREYIYLYLKHELEKLSKEGHGSVMAHLTKNSVENMNVISPPLDVIDEFHKTILPFIEHKKLLEKEILQLDELKELYLSKLVN